MTTVTINGSVFPVRGRAAWETLSGHLQACGWYEAAAALEQWRSNRRMTNYWSVMAWPVAPIFGTHAGVQRSAFLMTVRDAGDGRP
jgi:hypothetical protein